MTRARAFLSTTVAILTAGGAGAAVFAFAQEAERARVRADFLADLATLRAERIAALEAELAAALAAQQAVRALINERAAAEEAERKARHARLLAATRPLPEGLRLAVNALHELWGRSGRPELRILDVRAIQDHELRGVELFAAPANGEGAVLWRAERVDLRLDRGTGTLTVRLREGTVVRHGGESALPEAGETIVFEDVDGPMYEARLPYLVVAEGIYPEAEPRVPPRARLDPFTAQRWRERLNRLLGRASTPLRYRIHELEGLADGEFLGVVLFGCQGKRIEQMAEVERAAVVVDERAGTVELELIGGVFRRAGGDVPLPSSPPGQRILLVGVTPKDASDALTGMVVQR